MPRLLAHVLFLSGLLLATEAAAAETEVRHPACPGIAVASFEQRFPEQVRRYPFDRSLLKPFVELWQAGRRPALPLPPERVTVYAFPGRPFLIGYQRGGCVIAFLTVERQQLWRWLGPRIGWIV